MPDAADDKIKLTPQQRLDKIEKRTAELTGKPGSEEKLAALAERKKKITEKLGKKAG